MAFVVSTLVSALFLVVLINLQHSSALSSPQVPCFFIFGDSLVDNGNNNELPTLAKVDYYPYGIDFPDGPTGRFTNGLTTADFLARYLGFDNFIPPFATAQAEDIISGVNYASGSSGIRSESGTQLGENINLDKQLFNHNLTVSRITDLLGNDTSAKQHLGKCLYYFVIGSNDYINNYYMPEHYPTSSIYSSQEYAIALIQQYSQHLKTLYKSGARKISVNAIGPLGCIPAMVAKGTNGSVCVEAVNDAVRLFNDKLKVLVSDLNDELTDAKFIYISGMALRPFQAFGPLIRLLRTPCCQVEDATGQCVPGESPCRFRSLSFFYDNFHPTEVVNRIAAIASYVDILKLINS